MSDAGISSAARARKRMLAILHIIAIASSFMTAIQISGWSRVVAMFLLLVTAVEVVMSLKPCLPHLLTMQESISTLCESLPTGILTTYRHFS